MCNVCVHLQAAHIAHRTHIQQNTKKCIQACKYFVTGIRFGKTFAQQIYKPLEMQRRC